MIELKNTLENDSWIEKLLEWANENDISLPKKKDELLNLTELDLSKNLNLILTQKQKEWKKIILITAIYNEDILF